MSGEAPYRVELRVATWPWPRGSVGITTQRAGLSISPAVRSADIAQVDTRALA